MLVGVGDQRNSLDELHGEEGLDTERSLGTARLIDLCDSGVVQAAKRLRFKLETPCHFLVGVSRLDDLERDNAVGSFLLRFVDRTHAALRDEAQDPVMANGLRNTSSHCVLRSRRIHIRAGAARSIFGKRSRGGALGFFAHDLRKHAERANPPSSAGLGGGPSILVGCRP
jgi:hypothetical protein